MQTHTKCCRFLSRRYYSNDVEQKIPTLWFRFIKIFIQPFKFFNFSSASASVSNSANDNPNAGVDAGVSVSASARRIVRSISILFHIKKIFYNIVCYDAMIEIFIALCVCNAIKIFD